MIRRVLLVAAFVLWAMVGVALVGDRQTTDPVLRDCVLRRSDAGVFVDCSLENGDRVTYRVEENG